LFLELLFQLTFDLCKTLETVLKASEPFIGAHVEREVTRSTTMKNLVDRRTAHAVCSDEVADASVLRVILMPHFLALQRREACSFVNGHGVYTLLADTL